MRRVFVLLLAASIVLIGVITLSPHNTKTLAGGDRVIKAAKRVAPSAELPPEVRNHEADVIGNILLFAPFGFFGALTLTKRRALIVPAGVALSTSIELFQGRYLPHRTASVLDLFTNGAGTAVGAVFAAAVLFGFHRVVSD